MMRRYCNVGIKRRIVSVWTTKSRKRSKLTQVLRTIVRHETVLKQKFGPREIKGWTHKHAHHYFVAESSREQGVDITTLTIN